MHSCATSPSSPGVQHRVVRAQPGRNVVRGEDGRAGRRRPAPRHPSAGRTPRRSAGCPPTRTARPRPARRPVAGPASGASGWFGRYGARCDRTPTGPTPGPPPPCGMQNVLCRFRWLDVGAEPPGLGQPDQRVEVGAVDVDLAARVVHQGAQLGDGLLVHAVRRRVGDHDRGQVVARAARPWPAGRPGRPSPSSRRLDHDDPHAGHHRAGGVGAVRAGRDQADVAVALAVRPVVGADRQQPGQLALRAGVRLQRHRVVAGDLGQPRSTARRSAPGCPRPARPARTGAGRRTRAR